MFTERPIFFQNKRGKHISHPGYISQNKRLEHHLSSETLVVQPPILRECTPKWLIRLP